MTSRTIYSHLQFVYLQMTTYYIERSKMKQTRNYYRKIWTTCLERIWLASSLSPVYSGGSCSSIYSFLCSALYIIVCLLSSIFDHCFGCQSILQLMLPIWYFKTFHIAHVMLSTNQSISRTIIEYFVVEFLWLSGTIEFVRYSSYLVTIF